MAGIGATRLFIRPPHRFHVVDHLVTNFHLPRSTLLALVLAFAGVELTRRAYREAAERRYRFYSYGDAMLIRRGAAMSLPTAGFSFRVDAVDGDARCGELTTPRATIETPAFMPVGTQASVKALTPEEVASTGARIILANTYHLWLRPGAESVASHGGVVGFMKWPHALLTDSGGYQVFSLAKHRTIDDDGITFRSHLDGTLHRLTPEEAMRVQALLGSDIAMVLDECPPGGASRDVVQRAIARTTDWAERCLRDRACRRSGPVRYRSRWNRARFAVVALANHRGAQLRRGRLGGLLGGRAPGTDVRASGSDRSRDARRPPPLLDGCGHPVRSASVAFEWDRPLRLCPADSKRPQRASPHVGRSGEPPAGEAPRR